MDKTPDIFWKLPTQLWYFLGVPLAFLTISLFYRPFDIVEWLDMGRGLFAFNITIMMTITLLSMVITRLSLYFMRNVISRNWLSYIGLCFAEMVITSAFLALFVELMSPSGYFFTLGMCTKLYIFIAVIPYAIITLSLALAGKTPMKTEPEDSSLRFYDSNKALKFIVAESALLYIKAEENYMRIHYLDNDKIKDYQLRSSMTAIEPIARKGRLFRCHRSYYVNPRHIKSLRKDAEGMITAELDSNGIAIPVSKRYYNALSELL